VESLSPGLHWQVLKDMYGHSSDNIVSTYILVPMEVGARNDSTAHG
jgi:hypothetical protein